MDHSDILRNVGLRPTKQRLCLADILFNNIEPCHITAEKLHREVQKKGYAISLATIYNTLNQFVHHNLLKEIHINNHCCWYDTDTQLHFHFWDKKNNILMNAPEICPEAIQKIIDIPKGYKLADLNIIAHLESNEQ